MPLPPFGNTPCGTCGDADLSPCDPSDNCEPCISNKGKFYDKLTQDFTVPATGTEAKAYVCDPSLWFKSMWVALKVSTDTIAVFRITGINVSQGWIKLFNGCVGKEIADNPPSGTTIKSSSVMYPVPPQCAGSQSEIACATVKECLNTSTDVCFNAIPPDDDSEENHHLFVGTSGLINKATSSDETGFWASCLRKLRNIYTGSSGNTFCFKSLPLTTDSDDVIGDTSFPKRYVYFDTYKGCLRAGPTVGQVAESFCSSDALTQDGDGYKFTNVVVCKDGDKRKLTPICGYGIVAKSDIKTDGTGYDDPYWVYEKLNDIEYLDNPVVLRAATNALSVADPLPIANGIAFSYTFNDSGGALGFIPPCWANSAIIEFDYAATVLAMKIEAMNVNSNDDEDANAYMVMHPNGAISSSVVRIPITGATGSRKIRLKLTFTTNSGTTSTTAKVGIRLLGWAR